MVTNISIFQEVVTLVLDLDEAKEYLRVDNDYDDGTIKSILCTAEELVKDIARLNGDGMAANTTKTKIAVLYATAYLYEHREDADHHALTLSLRSLLFGVREAKF